MAKLNLLAAGDHIVVTWGTLCMDIITSSMISSHNGVYGNYIILKHGLDYNLKTWTGLNGLVSIW